MNKRAGVGALVLFSFASLACSGGRAPDSVPLELSSNERAELAKADSEPTATLREAHRQRLAKQVFSVRAHRLLEGETLLASRSAEMGRYFASIEQELVTARTSSADHAELERDQALNAELSIVQGSEDPLGPIQVVGIPGLEPDTMYEFRTDYIMGSVIAGAAPVASLSIHESNASTPDLAGADGVCCDSVYPDSCAVGPACFTYWTTGTLSTPRVLVLKASHPTTPGRTSLWFRKLATATRTFYGGPWDRLAQSLEFGVGQAQIAITAPALDRTVNTNTGSQLQFLYSGPSPLQVGVAPGTIDATLAAGLSGAVLDRDTGNPISGVTVSVLGQSAYGTTTTRADGRYNLAVNGGPNSVSLNFSVAGYLTGQRLLQVPPLQQAVVADLALVPVPTGPTQVVSLSSSNPAARLFRAPVVSDASGNRRLGVYFPMGTTVMAGGHAVTSASVRATEFTAGPRGVSAMPADLPPTSGYTYAVELSLDEGSGAQFSSGVPVYVDNFLNFPVGTQIPAGFYDRTLAQWIAIDNGRVIKVLSVTAGKADLVVDSSGSAANATALAALGVSDDERTQLATNYEIGSVLWRVPVRHFSLVDFNLGLTPPPGAKPGAPPPDTGTPPPDPCEQAANSSIECETQVLKESVPVAGTPFSLEYRSDRVAGRTDRFTLNIPITPHVLPGPVQGVQTEVTIAGRKFVRSFPALPDQILTFTWDGYDAFGRQLQGLQPATVRVGNLYDAQYANTPRFGLAGDGTNTGVSGRVLAPLSGSRVYSIGAWDATALGLGGWDLSIHHAYDPIGKVLNLGSGTTSNAPNIPNIVVTIAGTGVNGTSPDNTIATAANLNSPRDVAVGPDGLLYIAEFTCIRRVRSNGTLETYAGICGSGGDTGNGGPATSAQLGTSYLAFGSDGTLYFSDGLHNRLRAIAPTGAHIISLVAGTGSAGFSGDGAPATSAQINNPRGLSVGPDGAIYFVDANNNRVRRVGSDGVIQTIAGSGAVVSVGTGNDGPALNAGLAGATGIAVGVDGTVYIGELHQVRKVGTDGIIRVFAGNPSTSLPGDGGPATAAGLGTPWDLVMGADGSVYIADKSTFSIRRVDPAGLISTVAGVTNSFGFSGDLGPATAAKFRFQGNPGIAISNDDVLTITDDQNVRIRQVRAILPGVGINNLLVPSADGREIYVFNGAGKHLQTLDAFVRTPTPLYSFSYAAGSGYLNSVTDVDGNVTTIRRDPAGNVTGIQAPFGQLTDISIGPDGYIWTIANQVPEITRLAYSPSGLLQSKTDPRGNVSTYSYDTQGRLKVDAEPLASGGSQTLTYTPTSTGWSVDRTTKLGHTTTYKTETTSLNRQRTISRQDGTVATQTYTPDGGTVLLLPDGTQYTTTASGDPRFSMLAPITSTTVRTPSGLTRTETVTRTASLSTPTDLLSLTAYNETHSINGQPFQSTYDPTTRTWTSQSPVGRKRFDTLDPHAHTASTQIDTLLATQFTPDSHGRLTTIQTGTRTTNYGYDTTSGFLKTVTDALTRQTTFQTDLAGRTTRITHPDTNFTQLSYDLNGNLHSVTPPGATAHLLDHTPVDLLSLYTPPAVTGIATPQTSYLYDFERKPTLTTRPDGLTIQYGYDTKGRLLTTTLPTGTITNTYDPTTGKLSTIAGPNGETITLGYDGLLIASTTWAGPVAGSVAWTYDNSFRVMTEAVNAGTANSFAYDNDNLITGVGSLSATRDPKTGLISTITLGTVNETLTPDSFGALANYTSKVGTTTLFAMAITPDALGRISHKDETIGGVVTGYDYTYDTRGRLTDVKKGGVLVSHYDYDPNGNRLAGPTSGAIGTYDAQDRLKMYNGTTYAYEDNGELKTKTVGSAVTTYTYDVLGNLTSVALPGGATTVSYVVDGRGRRAGKKVNGTLVKGFLFRNSLNVAAELDGTNHVVSIFLYGTKPNVPDVMLRAGKTYRVISDQVGSVRLVVDSSNGAVAQRIDYDEFGRVANDTSPGFQPFGFAGGLYDADTGLVRFGARDYDPVVGRWVSKDPIGFDGRQANLYVYVNNDPVNARDPLGLFLDAECAAKIKDGCWEGCRSTCGGLLDGVCAQSCELLTRTIESAFPGSICNNENPMPKQPRGNCFKESQVVFQTCYDNGGLWGDCEERQIAYYDLCVAGQLSQ